MGPLFLQSHPKKDLHSLIAVSDQQGVLGEYPLTQFPRGVKVDITHNFI